MNSALYPAVPPVRSYRLYLSAFVKIMVFGILVVFTVVGVLMLLGVFAEGEPRFIGAFWLAVVGAFWYQVLTTPHRIEVSADGTIAFIAIARRTELSPTAVESIKPEGGQIGFFALKHQRGKIRLMGQFDGFHEFLTNLKISNPSVKLRGC